MNCKIVGYDFKTLEVTLGPGETFYAERGSIVYDDTDMLRDVEMTGSNGNSGLGGLIAGAVKSALSGESLMILKMTNPTSRELKAVLAGSVSSLIAIKIQGEPLVCRLGYYVASTARVEVGMRLSVSGLLGGLGAMFQKIEGNATVFVDSAGTAIERVLNAGETIEVDERHLVAMRGISESRIQAGWSIGNVLRGEGVSMMRITGPGTVYMSPIGTGK